LEQQITVNAMAKDPIAGGGMDQNLQNPLPSININAVWAGTALCNWALGKAIGNPDPQASWSGWMGSQLTGLGANVENAALFFNHHVTGIPQVVNILPKWAQTTYFTYAKARFAFHLLSSVTPSFISSPLVALVNQSLDPSTWEKVTTVTNGASTLYTWLRVWAAVKPVIDRIPAYRAAYQSRPSDVRKRLAVDLFNIGSQVIMSFGSSTASTTYAP
jgi:hypothetical protein